MLRIYYLLGLICLTILAFSCDSGAPVPQQKVTKDQGSDPGDSGKNKKEEKKESNNNNNNMEKSTTPTTTDNSGSGGTSEKKIDPKVENHESDLRGQALIKMRRYGSNDIKDIVPETPQEKFTNDLPASLVASGETIKNIALLNYHTPTVNQGEDGPCGAYAMSGAAENYMQKHYINDHIETNPHNFWNEYKSRLATDLIYTAEDKFHFKALNEDRETFNHSAKLKSVDYIFKTSQIKDAIDSGHPVLMATLVNNTWYSSYQNTASEKGLIECRDDANSNGGHYVTIVGYALNDKYPGGGVWVIRNSWGEGWADHGYGYLPIGCCKDVMCMFWEINGFEMKD